MGDRCCVRLPSWDQAFPGKVTVADRRTYDGSWTSSWEDRRRCGIGQCAISIPDGTRLDVERPRLRLELHLKSLLHVPNILPSSHHHIANFFLPHSRPPLPNRPNLHAHQDDHTIRQTGQRTLEDRL